MSSSSSKSKRQRDFLPSKEKKKPMHADNPTAPLNLPPFPHFLDHASYFTNEKQIKELLQ